MAARKIKTVSGDRLDKPTIEGDTSNIEELEGLQEDASDFDDYLERVFAEVGDDVRSTEFVLKVYQVLPNQGQLAWLFNCTPSELPILDRLRDDYNGGQFEIRIYKNNRIFRRKTIIVKAPINKTPKPDDSLAKLMVDGFNRIVDKLQTIPQQQGMGNMPQIIYDPAKVLEAMAGMMQGFQKMNMQNQPAPADPNSSIELFVKGAELASKFANNSGGGSESSMLDVLRDFLKSPLLETMAEQQRANAQVRPTPRPRTANPTPPQYESSVKVETPAMPTEDQQMYQMKMNYINMLLRKAQQDSSPELYAEYILDNVPEEIVTEHFTGEGVIDEIIKMQPAASQYRHWFTQLRDALIDMMQPVGDDGDILETDLTATGEKPSVVGQDTNSPNGHS